MTVAADSVWVPPTELRTKCRLSDYLRWLATERGRDFGDQYMELWRWSVSELDEFWATIWDYFAVADRAAPKSMLALEAMPGAVWCPGERLNYAAHLLRAGDDSATPALVCVGEDEALREISWKQLRESAGALAAHLRAVGVRPGDRVVGYLPNTEEPVVALIACASIGAVWSVCAPDYGAGGVISRFRQLSPKVFITTTGYRFAGKDHDRRREAAEIADCLPSVGEVIWVDRSGAGHPKIAIRSERWSDLVTGDQPLTFEEVAFDHPLWVLFSSGTTGVPKGVTHSHGGILLEHLKSLGLHGDVRASDRYMLLGSTSWMVWNVLVSSLLLGATAVLVDGSPTHPDLERVWRLADTAKATTVGLGAGLLHACEKASLRPRDSLRLETLRSVVSTGSPLSLAGHRWVRRALGEGVWLSSTSGGTDICSAFVAGCPIMPLRLGRIQAPCLGVAVAAWDEAGQDVIGTSGELVVKRPMPSMPLYLWGDADGKRYHDSYFAMYPNVWRHGDFIEFDADGSSVIGGRSDSTLNRNGVRLGSADIYQAVEGLPEVREALVVGVELSADEYYMPLFVHLADEAELDTARDAIHAAIRRELSPRHVPDAVIAVPGIPHTKTGKKLELPVKRLLQGANVAEVADADSVDHPELLAVIAHRAQADLKKATGLPSR